jgi:hypothetical protein
VAQWDPKTWEMDVKFDLIISDSLGGFGDDGGLEYLIRPLERNLAGELVFQLRNSLVVIHELVRSRALVSLAGPSCYQGMYRLMNNLCKKKSKNGLFLFPHLDQ